MALNATLARVAITGAVYSGSTSTTAPTDSTTALDSGFTDHGYVSEDGVTETYEDDVTDIKAWQNGQVIRSVISGSKATLNFRLIETKGKNLELYHKGSTVVATGAGKWKIDVKGATADPRSFVLDVLDGTKHIRLYVPNGEVTERGEITYVTDDVIGYEVTLTCYPDSSNNLLTKFSDDSAWGYS